MPKYLAHQIVKQTVKHATMQRLAHYAMTSFIITQLQIYALVFNLSACISDCHVCTTSLTCASCNSNYFVNGTGKCQSKFINSMPITMHHM